MQTKPNWLDLFLNGIYCAKNGKLILRCNQSVHYVMYDYDKKIVTKTQKKRGNGDIISEASIFIKGHVEKSNKVHLYSNIIEMSSVISDEDRDMKSLAKLKNLLANLGTHFNEKRGVLVPLNWENYSMLLS